MSQPASRRRRLYGGALWRVAAVAALCFAAASCAPHAQVMCEPLEEAYRGRLDRAVQALDATALADSKRGAFLYHAQRGHLLHLEGDAEASNRELELAVAVADALDPPSVSETLTDYLVNEAVKPYAGEDYERAYLHYYMLLNYLDLGKPGEALVEAKRLDQVFRNLDARYDDGRYEDDGFIRYLSGLLYESIGEDDEAFVDYRLAYRAYSGEPAGFIGPEPAPAGDSVGGFWSGSFGGLPAPSGLIASLRASAERSGAPDRLDWLPEGSDPGGPGVGEIVILIESGWAPYKVEESIEVPIHRALVPEDLRGRTDLAAYVKIAYPALSSVPGGADGFRVEVSAVRESARSRFASAERVADLDAMVRGVLERRVGAVVFRSTLRATAKQIALMKGKHALEERREREEDEGGRRRGVLGWLGDVLGWIAEDVATIAVAESEQADTRSWVLLPREIWMARISVLPGEYEVTVRPGGSGEPLDLGPVLVDEGDKVFESCRIFGGPHPMRCGSRRAGTRTGRRE